MPDLPDQPAESRSMQTHTLFTSRKQRIELGKQLQAKLPLGAHAAWAPAPDRPDPVDLLEAAAVGRIPELAPIRYGRMLSSPFTFLRGSAAVMARDLSTLPASGITVQCCGDCHLLNFGFFATPERNLVFDINDFDETLPAPWEWDVKRLAASFAVAARDLRHTPDEARAVAVEVTRAYREKLREHSRMSPLEIWYARLDVQALIDMSPDEETRKLRKQFAKKARERVIENVFPKIVEQTGGRHRFVDQPPLFYHSDTGDDAEERWRAGVEVYRKTLSDERRVLFDRYRLEDYALKVVGIGSVGTRCSVALMFSAENHPLILQIKEAKRSVLEPYTEPSRHENQGQRVVIGQRLMQSSSDIFLGWARNLLGADFYVRQLRDMKFSIPVQGASALQLRRYAEICGWTLARAHAKSGDSATISGYLGKTDEFDQAIGGFALAYADQTERDHAILAEAERSGRIQALFEDTF